MSKTNGPGHRPSGQTYKRCGCVDAEGRPLGESCPELRGPDGRWNPGHGTWFFAAPMIQIRSRGPLSPADRTGLRLKARRGHREWMRQRGLSDNTLRSYGRTLDVLADWLEIRSVSLLDASPELLTEWRAGLKVDSNSVLSYISAIKSFYGWAHRTEQLARNPARNIPLPRYRKGRPRPIADAPLEMAIANAGERVRPWLVLAAYGGLRACEIARLRREDLLDTAADPVMILQGKGNKERIVPLSPYVWQALVDYSLPSRGLVFLRRDGQPGGNRPKMVSHLANEHLHACGVHETLHQLRHRFGTATYSATHDLRVVQELMGHASPAQTAGYADYSRIDAIRAVNAVQPAEKGPHDDGQAAA